MSSQIRDDRRVFYAQMTSCAMRYDVTCHQSPINSQALNTSGADSPAFEKKRIKSYTSSPFSSCWANEPSDLYQSKAWCTTIHANMSFINLRLNETFSSSSSSFFYMKGRAPGVALMRTIEEHGLLPDWEAYCTGSESCPYAIVNLKLQF